MCRILSLLVLLIGASCSELTRTKDELTQNAQVYAEDAFNTLEIAKNCIENGANPDLLMSFAMDQKDKSLILYLH